MSFNLTAQFKPTGDQPKAIKKLSQGLKQGLPFQTLLGATGTGKTFTMASVIQQIKKPTLIVSHNKTLAAQLYEEFKEYFPHNAVHYFVSFYDYYQPEAYLPQTDTYIAKDLKINKEIDVLRHKAVQSLFLRDDVIIIASVSCIYNLGSPETYQNIAFTLKQGQAIDQRQLFEKLLDLQYERNDFSFEPGQFRVRTNLIDIWSVTEDKIYRLKIENEKIAEIKVSSSTFKNFIPQREINIFPAKFWLTEKEKINHAAKLIKKELENHLKQLEKDKKPLEAERLRRRTEYDLSMLQETGWCPGIENYSAHLEGRPLHSPPPTLLDYFPEDYLMFIDESHKTIPQIRGMYEGDHARKNTLVSHGFRLPSAIDNRPLKFYEFEKRINQAIFSSATPSFYEKKKSKQIVEQLIRPTYLLDPTIEIRPTQNQIQDLISEIQEKIKKKQRVLVTTLTKRTAEALSDFLKEKKIKSTYLHSEIDTLKRPAILRDLRQGKIDVLVGINLLREGLDLPEVSLIGILDADKESFLRDKTSLIQIMGRAARHLEGHIIMYADKKTGSMKAAIEETDRRRKIQEEYNKKHHKKPQPIKKSTISTLARQEKEEPEGQLPSQELAKEHLKLLKNKIELAQRNLQFDKAAVIKKEMEKVKKIAQG